VVNGKNSKYMKVIYMARTIQLIMNTGIELPEGHVLRSGEQPEVNETKTGEKYFVFNFNFENLNK
jgi:hypothetical protein